MLAFERSFQGKGLSVVLAASDCLCRGCHPVARGAVTRGLQLRKGYIANTHCARFSPQKRAHRVTRRCFLMTLSTLSCGRKLPALDVHWQQAPGYLGKQSDDARAFVHFCFSAHSPMLNTSRLVRQLPRAMAPAAKRPAANVVAPEAKKPCVQEKGSEGAEVNPASLQDTVPGPSKVNPV